MKKRFIALLLFISILTIEEDAIAQDPIFSQVYSAPLTLNPALTGLGWSGNNRVMVNYRNLLSPTGTNMFKTTAVSFERKLLKHKENNADHFNIGGLFLSERMGNGLLTQSYGNITSSFYNALNEDGSTGLSAGLSLTYGNRMIDLFAARTQDMFGSYGFTSINNVSNDPSLSNINLSFMYLNVGVGFDTKLYEKDKFHIGLAVFKASRPKETKLGGIGLEPRYVIESKYVKQISETDALELVGVSQWITERNFTTLGAKYAKQLEDKEHLLELGVLNRINQAVSPYVGFGINNIKFGLSYDIVTSKERTIFNASSTAELSFIWNWK